MPARILHVADAYDAMVSPRAFRSSMSREEAFVELRRCSGTQFDPEMAERCISVLSSNQYAPTAIPAKADAALRIASQLETLACAMDSEDITTLQQTASRIKTIADADDIYYIPELAEEISIQIDDDVPWTDVLLDLYRQAHSTHTSPADLAAQVQCR